MKILIATAEAVPYVKVGGLGDVAGALAAKLSDMGHEVRLVLPKYAGISTIAGGLEERLSSMGVPTRPKTTWCRVLQHQSERGFQAHFIEHHQYFSEKDVYGVNGDEGARFVFFSLACLQLCVDTGFIPDVIHVHDWPTSIVSTLARHREDFAQLSSVGCLLTIHNLAHQGRCPLNTLDFAGLPSFLKTPDQYEDHGQANLLKGGVAQADVINTVSPTYAREILSPIGGAGLHDFLRKRENALFGILNGIDEDIWNPTDDEHLPAHFSRHEMAGKAVCKSKLQAEFGLSQRPNAPLFGVVSRLVQQKGIDLILATADQLLSAGAQLVVVGKGEADFEQAFSDLGNQHPESIANWTGFGEGPAHRVIAGSDFLLVPSLFEPCGLTQMCALRYGTLPIVRNVGGLGDTVVDLCEHPQTGTGFRFIEPTAESFSQTLKRALGVYREDPPRLKAAIRRGMAQHFSWDDAAKQYVDLYTMAKATAVG